LIAIINNIKILQIFQAIWKIIAAANCFPLSVPIHVRAEDYEDQVAKDSRIDKLRNKIEMK